MSVHAQLSGTGGWPWLYRLCRFPHSLAMLVRGASNSPRRGRRWTWRWHCAWLLIMAMLVMHLPAVAGTGDETGSTHHATANERNAGLPGLGDVDRTDGQHCIGLHAHGACCCPLPVVTSAMLTTIAVIHARPMHAFPAGHSAPPDPPPPRLPS